jgi:hypothetical protein
MSTDHAEGGEYEGLQRFFIFMLVFWPVALILGVIDVWFITDHDLRLASLAVAAVAGWWGIRYVESKRETPPEGLR